MQLNVLVVNKDVFSISLSGAINIWKNVKLDDEAEEFPSESYIGHQV